MKNRKLSLEHHNHNCCKKDLPVNADINEWKIWGETAYLQSLKVSPIFINIKWKNHKSTELTRHQLNQVIKVNTTNIKTYGHNSLHW